MRIKDLGSRPAPAFIRELTKRMARGHGPLIAVERRQLPYWQERGWTRRGHTYTGAYKTPYAAFYGQIEQHPGGHIDFFLYSPSVEISRCSHWPCFQHRGSDWYLVHMGKEARDVSSGIMAIERLITEAFES